MLYCISDTNWANSYDARIELDGSDVLLHSRGGATGGRPPRNTDYEKALLTIVRRLRQNDRGGLPVIRRILLDSTVARSVAEDDRVLVTAKEMSGLTNEEVVKLVRQRARSWGQNANIKGGNSTKALRFEIPSRSHDSVRSTLQLMLWKDSGQKATVVERLPNSELRRVKASHIHNAVERLISGEDAPNFSDSRDYDVLLGDGLRLPPKKVFALALEEALEIEAFPGHFSAGRSEPCFEIILAAGYEIVSKGYTKADPAEVDRALSGVPATEEDRHWIEGDLKRAYHLRRERAAGLSKTKKAAFIAEHGHLFCERCLVDPIVHYETAAAVACVEVHHNRVLVSDMEEGHETRLEDLLCLCANCHRIVHREMKEMP